MQKKLVFSELQRKINFIHKLNIPYGSVQSQNFTDLRRKKYFTTGYIKLWGNKKSFLLSCEAHAILKPYGPSVYCMKLEH